MLESGQIENSVLANASAEFTSKKDREGFRIRRESRERRSPSPALRWDDIYVNKLQKSQIEKAEMLLDPSIKKYTFVRDPLERLLSAYRDKVQPNYQHVPNLGRQIHRYNEDGKRISTISLGLSECWNF